MVLEVTDKLFYKQLTGSYAGGMAAAIIGGAIAGFCTVFCGTQLGWTHLFTIIGLIVLIFCIGLLIFLIVKTARMKQHPVFRRYGSASELAAKINDGMQHPRYFAKGFDQNAPFATLITDEFIVSGSELVSYMELKDIRTIQPTYLPPAVKRIVIGNPLLTAGSLAANYAADRVMESKGINEQTRFDYFIIEDAAGKKRQYGIRHIDMEDALKLLSKIAPHVKISDEVKPMY